MDPRPKQHRPAWNGKSPISKRQDHPPDHEVFREVSINVSDLRSQIGFSNSSYVLVLTKGSVRPITRRERRLSSSTQENSHSSNAS